VKTAKGQAQDASDNLREAQEEALKFKKAESIALAELKAKSEEAARLATSLDAAEAATESAKREFEDVAGKVNEFKKMHEDSEKSRAAVLADLAKVSHE